MRAEVGNWLVVRNRLLDRPVRAGEIVEVPHPDGSPPWTVHWLDDERISVVFPGSDAVVMTAPPSRADVPTDTRPTSRGHRPTGPRRP